MALLAEEYGGLGKEVGRQFLRTHRAFTATILTPDGAAATLQVAAVVRLCICSFQTSHNDVCMTTMAVSRLPCLPCRNYLLVP